MELFSNTTRVQGVSLSGPFRPLRYNTLFLSVTNEERKDGKEEEEEEEEEQRLYERLIARVDNGKVLEGGEDQ